MSNFKSYELQDLCDFQNGFAFKNTDYIGKSDKSIEVLRMGYIKRGGGFKEDNSPVFVSDSHHMNIERYRLKKGDIVMAMTDMKNSMAILGYSARVPLSDRFLLNQRVGRIRVIKENIVDELYLYYFLNSPEYIHSLQSKANSGVQVNLGTSTIKQSIIYLPSLNQQRMVAEILGCLDEKIELNTQINQTLEQIAQAIFKSWFIDFDPVKAKAEAKAQGSTDEQANIAAMSVISGKSPDQLNAYKQTNPTDYQQLYQLAQAFPSEFEEIDGVEVPKGWGIVPLDKIANYQNGLALQKFRPENENEFLPVVKIAQLKQGFADSSEKASIHIKPECIIDNGDVIFSWSGSLMVDIWCGGKAALNQHLFKVTSKVYPKWLYYLWTSYHLAEFQRIAQDKAVTMGHIKREHLSQAMCVIPDKSSLEKFNFIEDYINKIILNRLNNFEISKVRDLLLPKLLNNQITIKE